LGDWLSQLINRLSHLSNRVAWTGTSANTACLLVMATGLLEGGRPLWQEATLYRSDVDEFRNQLGSGTD